MYAIKIRQRADKDLLKLLDPSGSAMIGSVTIPAGAYLIFYPEDPTKNEVVTEREFAANYSERISANNPLVVKLNKS